MHLTAERLVFLLGSLFVPGVIVVANFAIRSFKGWYYTAGTDFLVAQMTFSFSSAILVKDMAPYIQHPYIREAANGIFVSLGLVIFLVWLWTVSKVERDVNDSIRQNIAPKLWRQGNLFISWACVVVFFAAEIMTFIYR